MTECPGVAGEQRVFRRSLLHGVRASFEDIQPVVSFGLPLLVSFDSVVLLSSMCVPTTVFTSMPRLSFSLRLYAGGALPSPSQTHVVRMFLLSVFRPSLQSFAKLHQVLQSCRVTMYYTVQTDAILQVGTLHRHPSPLSIWWIRYYLLCLPILHRPHLIYRRAN